MRYRIINLKKFPIYKARRIIKRLHKFIKNHNIKTQLIFVLPYYKPKKMSSYQVLPKSCPYCGSSLKETKNGIVCSQNKIRDIWIELRELRATYGDKAEYFLTTKQNRFYYLFMKEGRVKCNYCQGNEEKRWRKGPLY